MRLDELVEFLAHWFQFSEPIDYNNFGLAMSEFVGVRGGKVTLELGWTPMLDVENEDHHGYNSHLDALRTDVVSTIRRTDGAGGTHVMLHDDGGDRWATLCGPADVADDAWDQNVTDFQEAADVTCLDCAAALAKAKLVKK